jgi:uncharacterized membrane protein HdeD (DUF308 family)
MNGTDPRLARRFKLAAVLASAGLAVEVLTLFWPHPTAFLAFLFVGALLVAAGVLLYLYSVVSYTTPPPS